MLPPTQTPLPLSDFGILRQGANFTYTYLPSHWGHQYGVFSIWCLSSMENGHVLWITDILIAVATLSVIDPNVSPKAENPNPVPPLVTGEFWSVL